MSVDRDDFHRGWKLETDDGTAVSLQDAKRIVSQYVLQIRVADSVARSETDQAILLTAVNAGVRAFGGGVHVQMGADFELLTRWDEGRPVKEVLAEFEITDFEGVRFVDELDPEKPTIVIGDVTWQGRMPLYATWEGWAGGVVPEPDEQLPQHAEFALTSVLVGGLAVSEAFQRTRGYKIAATRPVGVSLWRPDLDWKDPAAAGPALHYIPDNFWLLGLGHLGQANAWALGFLPFARHELGNVTVMLQDFDKVVRANEATSLLVRKRQRGSKTRLVEEEMCKLGFTVLRADRRFDRHTHRNDAEPAEPRLALAGFDKIEPRRLLDDAGFDFIVDVGIGAGPEEYLDISLHTFPGSRTAQAVFADGSAATDADELVNQPAYEKAAADALQRGEHGSTEAAKCGLLNLAGATVAAAFVGTVAGALAVSEMLRLVDGERYETVSLELRSPENIQAYSHPEKTAIYPSYTTAEPAPL